MKKNKLNNIDKTILIDKINSFAPKKMASMILLLFAFFFIYNTNVLNATVTSFEYNNEKYNYKNSNYVLSQSEADKMIKEYGDLVAPKNDEAPKGYPYFIGYNNATKQAMYSDKQDFSKARASINVKAVATFKFPWGGGWSSVMQDDAGTFYYCLDFHKTMPLGVGNFKASENATIQKALSYGYPNVKQENISSLERYAKTQVALWMSRGDIKYDEKSKKYIGSTYLKVYYAYKGKISENKKTLTLSGKLENSGEFSGIPNQNVTSEITIKGTSKFTFTTAQYKKLTDKGIYAYGYNKKTKKWVKMKANTIYNPATVTKMRLATTNKLFEGKISNVALKTEVKETAGYIWDNGKSGEQRIVNYYKAQEPNAKSINGKFKSLGGKYSFAKQEDRTDLFGENIKIDGNILYNTSDGKYKYVEEDGLVTAVNYPSKAEMDESNLYEQLIKYQAPVLKPVMIEQIKVDPITNDPIQKVDENNQPVFEEDGVTPVWETEQVIKKNDNGDEIYEAVKNTDGTIQYQEVISTSKYLTLKGMLAQKFIKAKFGIYEQTTGKLIEEVYSSEDGIVNGELVPGKYYLQELDTMDETLKLDKTKYNFEVVSGDTAKINNGKVITNYELTGDVVVYKVDKDFKDRLLAGAGFLVFQLDKNGEYNDEEPYSYFESDLNGKIEASLPEGDYVLKEIKAPNGYILDVSTEYKINVVDSKETELSIENEQIKEKFKIKKTDAKGNMLAGAHLKIYSKNGNGFVKNIITKTEEIEFTGFFDMKEVCVVETKAPDGFKLNDKPQCFNIDNDEEVNYVRIVNKKKEELVKTGFTKPVFNIFDLLY